MLGGGGGGESRLIAISMHNLVYNAFTWILQACENFKVEKNREEVTYIMTVHEGTPLCCGPCSANLVQGLVSSGM